MGSMQDVYRTLNKASTVQDVSTTMRSCLVGLLLLVGRMRRSTQSFGIKIWIYPNEGVGSAARPRLPRRDRGGGRRGAFCRFPTNLAPKVCVMTALGPLRTI